MWSWLQRAGPAFLVFGISRMSRPWQRSWHWLSGQAQLVKGAQPCRVQGSGFLVPVQLQTAVWLHPGPFPFLLVQSPPLPLPNPNPAPPNLSLGFGTPNLKQEMLAMGGSPTGWLPKRRGQPRWPCGAFGLHFLAWFSSSAPAQEEELLNEAPSAKHLEWLPFALVVITSSGGNAREPLPRLPFFPLGQTWAPWLSRPRNRLRAVHGGLGP